MSSEVTTSRQNRLPRVMGRSLASHVRISVRALIIVVLIVGGGLGWVVRRSQIQRDAVAAIGKVGGIVQYEWEYPPSGPSKRAQPWWPKWLMEWVGVERLQETSK